MPLSASMVDILYICSFGNTIGECSQSLHLLMSESRHWAIIKNNGQAQHDQVPSTFIITHLNRIS